MKSYKVLWIIAVPILVALVYWMAKGSDGEDLPRPEATLKLPLAPLLQPGMVKDIVFTLDGKYLIVSAMHFPTLQVWDLKEKKLVAQFDTRGPEADLSVGKDVAVAGGGCTLILIKPQGRNSEFRLLTKEDPNTDRRVIPWYTGVAVSPSGQKLAACKEDGSLELWNLEEQKRIELFDWFDREPCSLHWLDETRLLILLDNSPIPRKSKELVVGFSEVVVMDFPKKEIVTKTKVPRLRNGSILGILGKDKVVLAGTKEIDIREDLHVNGKFIRQHIRSEDFPYVAVLNARSLKIEQDYLDPRAGHFLHQASFDPQRSIVYYLTSFTPDRKSRNGRRFYLALLDVSNLKPIRQFRLPECATALGVSKDGKSLGLSIEGWLTKSVHIYDVDSLLNKE